MLPCLALLSLLLLTYPCRARANVDCMQIQGNFTKEPLPMIQAQGLDAMFECQYNDTGGGIFLYNWCINGRFFDGSSSIRETAAGDLIVTALPKHNNTAIQCEADVRRPDGIREMFLSDNSTLQVQGPLDPVINLTFDTTLLSSTSITISWTAPFSLNLTTAEPDIQYCVNVHNVTGGEDNHIHSECNITDTSYTFPANDPDQLFNFTVTPRSNVEGSLNGTTSPPVLGCQVRTIGSVEYLGTISGENGISIELIYTLVLNVTNTRLCPVMKIYVELHVDPINLQREKIICPTVSPLENDQNLWVSSFSSNQNCAITPHNLYNLRIIELYGGVETVSDDISFSTHYIQNLNVNGSFVSCNYLGNTRDNGLFLIFHNGNGFHYYHEYRKENENFTSFEVTGLPTGSYRVAVYDLSKNERDGGPEPKPAALLMDNIVVNSVDRTQLNSLLESHIVTTPVQEQICLSCTFPSELDGCVGVFHESQFENVTLTAVLIVRESGGMSCTEDDVKVGSYHYAIFGLRAAVLEPAPTYQDDFVVPPDTGATSMPPSPNNVAPLAGGLSAALILILIIIIAVIIWKSCGNTEGRSSGNTTPPQGDPAPPCTTRL